MLVGVPCSAEPQNDKYITIYPAKSDKVLFNPGMGVYVMGLWLDPKFVANVSGFSNIIYQRFTWAELEPEEGKYRFDKVLGEWMRPWNRFGFRIAFGVMSTTLGQSATPEWVFKSGVPGVVHMFGKQVDPVYWDKSYLDLYERFVMALGKYLNGGQNIEFIDMRGIGVWGEAHLGTFIKGMWTKEELQKTGHTAEKYNNAHKRMIDIYKKALPDTRLFLSYSDDSELIQYASLRGIGIRYDGVDARESNPGPKKVSKVIRHLGDNNNTGSHSHLGVPINYELKEWETDPRIINKTLNMVIGDPISYFHANIGGLKTLRQPIENDLMNTALKLGYRFSVHSLRVEKNITLRKGESTPVFFELELTNGGIAPCYRNYGLLLSITDQHGLPIYQDRFYPEPSTIHWYPNMHISLKRLAFVPASTKLGKYFVTMEMFDESNRNQPIRLDVKKKDKSGRYIIAGMDVGATETETMAISFLQID